MFTRSLLPALIDRVTARPERLVESFFDDFFDDPFFAPARMTRTFAPPVDVTEDRDEYIVRCEVPGLEAKDLEIEHAGDVLTIRGEKRNEREGKKDGTTWMESSYGAFTRAIRLGKPIDAGKIAAELKNGVLTVHVPKAEEAKPRRVEVKAADPTVALPAPKVGGGEGSEGSSNA